jgi:hypothetical protein
MDAANPCSNGGFFLRAPPNAGLEYSGQAFFGGAADGSGGFANARIDRASGTMVLDLNGDPIRVSGDKDELYPVRPRSRGPASERTSTLRLPPAHS